MKKLNKLFVAAAASLMAAPAFAQYKGFTEMASSAEGVFRDALIPIINIASIVIGVVAVIMLIWNYIKRSKADGQGNDALASWGFSLIFAILALQIVKIVFL